MPISALCGACSAKLNAPDAAAGKTVKCPKCGNSLVIPVPSDDFEAVDESTPKPKPAMAKPKPAMAKPKPVLFGEDDEDDAPPPKRGGKKPSAKRNALPFLLGGGVLGLALVGFLVYWFVLRVPEVAKAPPTNPPGGPGVPAIHGGSGGTPKTPPPGWVEFKQPDFTAWFKGGEPTTEAGPGALAGNRMFHRLTRNPNGLHMIHVLPIASGELEGVKADPDTAVDGVVKQLATASTAQILSKTSATLAGHNGLGYSIRVNNENGYIRACFANGRIYVLTTNAPGVSETHEHFATFFDGFRLTGGANPLPKDGSNAGGPDSSLGKWDSDPALLDRLSEVETIKGYQYRRPKEYGRPVHDQRGATQSVIWQAPPGQRNDAAKFWVMVGTVTQAERQLSLKQSCALILAGFKQKMTDYAESEGEYGEVNGLKFFRQTVQGKEAKNGLVGRALVYHGRDGDNYFHIFCMDTDPNFESTRPLLEAAARTFRKQ